MESLVWFSATALITSECLVHRCLSVEETLSLNYMHYMQTKNMMKSLCLTLHKGLFFTCTTHLHIFDYSHGHTHSDTIFIIFSLRCHACLVLSSLQWEQSVKLLHHVKSRQTVPSLCQQSLFLHSGKRPLPLQMFASGQSLCSISGPGHWLFSSLETGRPESKSKQARKRLCIETILFPVMTSAREGKRLCKEGDGTQGEQEVHSDHSLRITARGKETAWSIKKLLKKELLSGLSAFSPSHSLVSQCKVPSWQRLENRAARNHTITDSYIPHDRKKINRYLESKQTLNKIKVLLKCSTASQILQESRPWLLSQCLLMQCWKGCSISSLKLRIKRNETGSNQVLQPIVTVEPWETVTGRGSCPEPWCCRWMQPHSSGGTQLPFFCINPWRGNEGESAQVGLTWFKERFEERAFTS